MSTLTKATFTAQPTLRVLHYIRETGQPAEVVLGQSRKRPIVQARTAVIQRLRADDFTTGQIARWMGRHHTTVSAAVRGGKGKPCRG